MSKTAVADTTCTTCGTIHLNAEVFGDCAVIESTDCATCGKPLCNSCDQAKCGGCDKLHCADHLLRVQDGTSTGLQLCKACVAECEADVELVTFPACNWCCLPADPILEPTTGNGRTMWHTRCFNEAEAIRTREDNDSDDIRKLAVVVAVPNSPARKVA